VLRKEIAFQTINERKEKNMNKSNKNMSTLIAMFLTIIMIASSIFAILPMVNAQTVQKYPTFLFAAAAPNPVGVGQQVTIVTWTAEMPPDIGETAGTVVSPSTRAGWYDLTLTITKPDNTQETIKLPYTDPVGTTYHLYTPNAVGTYSIQTHFPETWKNTTTSKRFYEAKDSSVQTFVVQEEQLSLIPGVPLPTEYWTRPINSFNREWYTIAGNWLADGKDNQLTAAPGSGHIMWTKPTQAGGMVGGTNTIDLSYYEGTSYEQRFTMPIIINGVLYYNQPLNHRDVHSRDYNTMKGQEYVAVDLRTGEEIWRDDNLGIERATIYEYYSPNQHGAQAYLWEDKGNGNLTAYDPFTGALLFNIYNVPSGAPSVGPNGEYMQYMIGGPTTSRTWLALWNFSRIPTMLTGTSGSNYWQWRPAGDSGRASQLPLQHNGTNGYSWNVTLPAGINGNIIFTLPDRVIGGSGYGGSGTSVYTEQFTIWAVKTTGDQKGQLLFNIKPKGPVANETLQFEGTMVNQACLDAGVFVVRAKETRQWMGFDINTGEQLWITEPQTPWMMYTRTCAIADGTLYSGGYGGELNAYDLKTGALLWNNTVDLANLDAPYDRYPIGGIYPVDGKVFVITAEHSLTQPYYRGWSCYVFDNQTGARIWDMTGYWKIGAFADGYWATYNAFDMSIYVFGKGPSQTTVSVQNDIATYGDSVMIKGNVMDVSAGAKSSTIAPRFPNGLPAVSDESMTAFMKYVYMQQVKPQKTSGVPVTFEVIDANGNQRPIGSATSDANGMFSFRWVPDIEGNYKVIATFAGSESYWPSQAETTFFVESPAPTPTAVPVVASPPPTEMYFVASTVAIIIAIAIVGLLLLRKRP
jgi:hypothetical protein